MNEMQLTAELETAMSWLQQRRGLAPADADYWHLRHHWATVRPALCAKLLAGTWRLTPMQVVGRFEKKVLWSACDALVLKWVTSRLTPLLPVHPRCEHVKGHGGGATSVARLSAALAGGEYRYVFRTDIRGYYGAMNKSRVMRQLAQYVDDPVLLDLVSQYLHYTVEDGGEFHTPEKGIARGCPLSPLIGAFHLYTVDAHFAAQKNIVYARYMDDFVILAKSRWSLRRQVKALNECLASHDFEKHPDKTFVGRVEKGFDWLGAWLAGTGVTGIAPRALANHREKVRRLYERLRSWPRARAHARVSLYRSRWKIWALCLIACAPPFIYLPECAAGWYSPPKDVGVNLKACEPVSILRWNGGSNGVYGNGYVYSGGVRNGSGWAGRGPIVPIDLPTVSADQTFALSNVDSLSCGGTTYYGMKSADGHALIGAYLDTSSPQLDGYSWFEENGAVSTFGSLYTSNYGGTLHFGVEATAGQLPYPFNLHYTWPSYIMGPPLYKLSAMNQVLSLFLVWDGSPPPDGPSAYSVPAGTFLGVGYIDSQYAEHNLEPNPRVDITFPIKPPSCALLIDGGDSATVALGFIDASSCVGPSCPAVTKTIAGATTTVSVRCVDPGHPSSWDHASVRPVVQVSGDVNLARSKWLLRSSAGDPLTIWGTSVPGDNFGCGFRGWVTEDHDPSHGGVPYASNVVWVPFPGAGPSYGVDSPWGDTREGWGADNIWLSKSATIQWGVCLDPSAGPVPSGPFSASATLNLVVP